MFSINLPPFPQAMTTQAIWQEQWLRVLEQFALLGARLAELAPERQLKGAIQDLAVSETLITGRTLDRKYTIKLTSMLTSEAEIRGLCTVCVPKRLSEKPQVVGRFQITESGFIYTDDGVTVVTSESIGNGATTTILPMILYAVARLELED